MVYFLGFYFFLGVLVFLFTNPITLSIILALIVLITWKICVSGTESKEDSVKNSTSFHVVSSSLDEEDTIIKSYFKNFNEKTILIQKL